MTDLLYELIYVSVSSLGVLSLLGKELGIDVGIIEVVIGLISAGIFLLYKRLKMTGRLIITGILIMIIITGVLLYPNDIIRQIMIEKISYIWLPVIGLIGFTAGELICFSKIIRVIVSAAGIGWMAVCPVFGFAVEKLFVAAGFMIVLLTVTELVQSTWEKQGHTGRKGHVVYLSPFIFIIAIFVFVMPAPDKPYDWGLAVKIYEFVTDTVEGLVDSISDLFSENTGTNPAETAIGFSERGDITGSVSGGHKKALTVSGLSTYVDQIRLSGQTFTDFDGKQWTNNDDSDAHANLIDTISMCAAVDDYTDRDNDYVRRTYVKIDYDGIDTEHVFIPLKSVPDNYGLQTDSYIEKGGNIRWSESRSEGSMYSISYFIQNSDNKIIDDFMEKAKAPTPESYKTSEGRLNTNKLSDCGYEDYLSYVEHIKKTYSDAPVLSQELRAYMDKVYDGAKSDYDKMNRLESMLRGFDYTLSPGPLPDSIKDASDFLDYFMLEKKEGFCTHFATAFVLLARAEGMSARYVQGYMANTKGKTSVNVRNSDAHAWPEVYFEGPGWVSFEPTASLNAGHFYWKTREEKDMDKNPLVFDFTGEDEAEDGVGSVGLHIEWYMIAIPIAVGILFIILAFMLRRVMNVIGLKKMTEGKKLVYLCEQNLVILKLFGVGIRTNETLYEYRQRLLGEDIKDVGFLDEYEIYLYKEEVADGATDRIKSDKEMLLLSLKKKSIRKYLRYLMGIYRR